MICWVPHEMLFGSGLAILLLLATSSAQTSPQPCQCSALHPAGLQINCSSLSLRENNQLSTVPPGHFDRMQGLRRVTLSGNPFYCNCEIQYLSTWLKRNGAVVSGAVPTCASPSSILPCSSVGRAWCLQHQGCGFDSHGGPADSLKSLKPKHRRTLQRLSVV
uniref:LRRCT domain-containing protein n=1 Tax=Salmo trutta TaxID=8032 RepID=A0A673WHD4_SALTR